MQFRRIHDLPPYVFATVDQLKRELRREGRDVIDLGFGNPDIPSPPAAVEVLETVDPLSLKYSVISLIGTCALLMLWTLLPKRQVTHAHAVTTLDDYAAAFDLPSEDIADGRDSRITTVHSDEDGRIVGLHRQV
jgi:hypothetical protein